jgi:hypothetical protein
MIQACDNTLEAARSYRQRGWMPVPIPFREKGPRLPGWQQLRLAEDDLPRFFNGVGNIGLLLGEPSGWLADVDLDYPEALELADAYLPPTDAVTGRAGAPRSHRWYIAEGAVSAKHTDPKNRSVMVELRSTGLQTVVGPSIHPSGEPYDVLTGEPAEVDGKALAKAVHALAQAILLKRHGTITPCQPKDAPLRPVTVAARAVGDSADIERRAIAYLDAMPPAISGEGGHNATYAAATALVHGFELAPDHALRLLIDHYNPRCEPPWSEKELRHKVDDAADKPHERPRGWLSDGEPVAAKEVDLSAFRLLTPGHAGGDTPPPTERPLDPGPLPEHLLRVPGFIGEVMDFSLATAPYPNTAMAFCGALALQAFLAGRKVRDSGDTRTNVYLLGLAHSAAGKDHPRKVNTRIVHEAGLVDCLGDRFASGEGVQDALFVNPCMLFQTDEIDGMLQSINKAKDARHESVMSTLLTLYSSSNSVFPMRRKAGMTAPGVIDQPNLVIFGTAIPNHYYEALSERMLTNGFFARMVIVESGPRGSGQEARIADLPPRVVETARWWADYSPGKGNLQEWHPVPAVVEATDEALAVLVETREEADAEYARAEQRNDPVGTTVWGRFSEHVRKLALLYAISEDCRSPRIGAEAVGWASQFVLHQTRRMLYMASSHVADNPFHAECLRMLKKLRESPDRTLPHHVLLKRMKMDAKSFRELIETLVQRGDITIDAVATEGRTRMVYRLEVNESETS